MATGNFRPGVAASSDYPPVVLTLGRKGVPRQNIVIGDDHAQVLWMEHVAGMASVLTDKLTDAMLLGQDACLYRVAAEHRIDLSPDVKAKTGIWSADPILKGSAALNHIIKWAAAHLPDPPKLTRKQIDIVAAEVMRHDVVIVPAAIGRAMTATCGPMEARKAWTEPWLDPATIKVEWSGQAFIRIFDQFLNSSAVYVAHSLKGKCSHAPIDASHPDADAQTPFADLSQDPASEPNFLSPIKLDEHTRFTDVY